mmetsp:Transcript_17579/g.27172  ORF Transcript_17579/g.27172 Transcript_17579/m.27172 type:complete len:96 (-) Transcript_17579:1061-1348(-)
MTFMVQDLLDFAQIKAKKFRKNITEFNIREAIEDIVAIQSKKAEDSNLRLFTNFTNIAETPLEATDQFLSPIINTDQQRVKQVLLSLQSNALKFT